MVEAVHVRIALTTRKESGRVAMSVNWLQIEMATCKRGYRYKKVVVGWFTLGYSPACRSTEIDQPTDLVGPKDNGLAHVMSLKQLLAVLPYCASIRRLVVSVVPLEQHIRRSRNQRLYQSTMRTESSLDWASLLCSCSRNRKKP